MQGVEIICLVYTDGSSPQCENVVPGTKEHVMAIDHPEVPSIIELYGVESTVPQGPLPEGEKLDPSKVLGIVVVPETEKLSSTLPVAVQNANVKLNVTDDDGNEQDEQTCQRSCDLVAKPGY